jgi:hypothetical protein
MHCCWAKLEYGGSKATRVGHCRRACARSRRVSACMSSCLAQQVGRLIRTVVVYHTATWQQEGRSRRATLSATAPSLAKNRTATRSCRETVLVAKASAGRGAEAALWHAAWKGQIVDAAWGKGAASAHCVGDSAVCYAGAPHREAAAAAIAAAAAKACAPCACVVHGSHRPANPIAG